MYMYPFSRKCPPVQAKQVIFVVKTLKYLTMMGIALTGKNEKDYS